MSSPGVPEGAALLDPEWFLNVMKSESAVEWEEPQLVLGVEADADDEGDKPCEEGEDALDDLWVVGSVGFEGCSGGTVSPGCAT